MFRLTKKCVIALVSISAFIGYYLYPEPYPLYDESDHYSQKSQQFFNPTTESKPEIMKVAQALWQMLISPEKYRPTATLPTQKPNFELFLQSSPSAKFIWFGHSTLLARMANQTIFIDPVFAKSVSPIPIMMKRFQDPPASLEELPNVDIIIYSHNHYDHLDEDVVRYYAVQKTHFIVPLAMGTLLKKWGIAENRIQELDWWQSVQLGTLKLTAVPSRHNSGRGIFDKNKTLWAGYVFQTESEQFYYSGDSAFGDGNHFQQIAEKFGYFDLAFVENGQYNLDWISNHMMPEQTAKAVELLNTKRFMPVHWGAYPLSIHPWDEPVSRSIPLIEKMKIQAITPMLGEIFSKDSKTSYWWQRLQ